MKFKVGDLIVNTLSGALYEVLFVTDQADYKIIFVSLNGEERTSGWMSDDDVIWFDKVTESHLLDMLSMELRSNLISNYIEGL